MSVVEYCVCDNSRRAGRIVGQAIAEKMPKPPDVVLLFCTIAHAPAEIIYGIHQALPGVPVCGCSSYGSITADGCDEATFSLCAVGLGAEGVDCIPFLEPDLATDCRAAGERIAAKLNPNPQAKNHLLLLFPDAFNANMTALLEGLESCLPIQIDIVGGMASNDYQLEKTFQFLDEDVVTQGVSGLLLSGELHYGYDISHGSRCIGGSHRITRRSENIVYEIDGEPALDLLQRVIGGEGISDFGQLANVIGLGVPFHGRNYCNDMILRAVMGCDREAGSIQLGAELEEGQEVYFTIRDQKRIAAATTAMTKRVLAQMIAAEDALYLYINCDGRGSYLYGEPQPDVETMKTALAPGHMFGGFFTFGEIASMQGKGYLHNYTGILLGLELGLTRSSDA